MVRAVPSQRGYRWWIAACALLAATALVVYTQQRSGVSPVSLVQTRTAAFRRAVDTPHVQTQDLTRALSGMGKAFDKHVASLEMSAKGLERKAKEQAREAKQELAVKEFLTKAQSELNAYAVNLEGMMTAGGEAGMRADINQFPKEMPYTVSEQAANLHALLDESLSKADALAVKMAKGEEIGDADLPASDKASPTPDTRTAQQKFEDFSHQMPPMAKSPLQPAFPPKGWKAPSSEAKQEPKVDAIIRKLRRVKSFAKAEGSRKEVHAGKETMLVQPAPLLGAMPVRDGELYRPGTLYDPTTVVEPESEEEKEEEELMDQMHIHDNATSINAEELVRACNSTCQELIVHSTLGLAFKVAAKCVPECASGEYMMHKHGKPLPPWTTVDELKEQDAECKEDDKYLECKLDALDPVCDKLVDVMPQYCPSHPHEGICIQCREMEVFTLKKEKAKNGGSEDCLLGILC